jgi:hypothetical protein
MSENKETPELVVAEPETSNCINKPEEVVELNIAQPGAIDLSRPWEHFTLEEDEREIDQKIIKVIEGLPAEV